MDNKSLTVNVLLCTFNGERFLEEQLKSLSEQEGVEVRLHISDDGSTDETLKIVKNFSDRLNMATPIQGPQKGPAANFLSLATKESISGQWFAFCDQDDIWEPGKLKRALETLEPFHDTPALYCSHSKIIDGSGKIIGHSKRHTKPPSFRNAFVQNISSGHTMVFNAQARELLMKAKPVEVRFHDWWLYILVTFAGGKVIHDQNAFVRYRQHDHNDIGPHAGWKGIQYRIRRLLAGTYRQWIGQHIDALEGVIELGTPEQRMSFEKLTLIHSQNFITRCGALFGARFYRQTFLGQAALRVFILIGKA